MSFRLKLIKIFDLFARVSECLKASEEVNNKLQSENQFLKELLDKHGIVYDNDNDGDGDITILS